MKRKEEDPLVLIVDDIPKNLQVLGNLLKNEGYRIAFAKNGENALQYLTDNQPDLILLDIMMPGMDGYEVCKRIKKNHHIREIPVIFITALGEEEDEYRGFKIGCVDYITKPFNPRIVKARVATHLRLKRKSDLLESISAIDGLTDIPNRRKFDETLEREWLRAKRNAMFLSLILCDIDDFKNYNDCYGHAAGDECLRRIAQALAKVINRPGDLAARYGGEEFGIILSETKKEGAVHLAEKMRLDIEALHIPHEKSCVNAYVTISVGVAAITPTGDLTPTVLVETADTCLYAAKKGGRNQVNFG